MAVESVQKIKTAGRSNSAFNKQDKRKAKTVAVNSNLDIDTDLIGANLDFPKRNEQWTKFFCMTMQRYEHAPYANKDALAKQ